MYWGFGPDWLGWGCGCYYPDKPLMDALRLHIRKEADDVRRCLRALDGRFEMYGEDYKKLAVPADVPEDLRALYVKKHFGFEHNGTQADWALWHTHDMADAIAAVAARPPFAVAVNTVFVPNTRYAEQVLQTGDRVEIISPVTGG